MEKKIYILDLIQSWINGKQKLKKLRYVIIVNNSVKIIIYNLKIQLNAAIVVTGLQGSSL